MPEDGVDGVVGEPVRAVIDREDGDRTGIVEGRLAVTGDRVGITVGDGTIGCALVAIDRVIVDSLPSALASRFEGGIAVQWRVDGGWRRAFIELTGDALRRVFEALCASTLDDSDVRVEQTIASNSADAGAEPRQWGTDTTLRIDTEASEVRFGARELEPVRPATVTASRLDRDASEAGKRPCVHLKAVTPSDRIETLISPSSESNAALVRDFVAGSQAIDGVGGPIEVLVVDDEPALVELAKMHLRDEHEELSVRFATHTQHAIALIEEEAFECIVTDYSMPEGGAPDILHAVRERDPTTPFVVFSRKDPRDIPDAEKPPDVDRWIRKEMGSDQYHRLALTIQRLVAPRRVEGRAD